MKFKKAIFIGLGILIILIIGILFFQKEPIEDSDEWTFPDGQVSGIVADNGKLYLGDNYDSYYGHAEDLIGTSFEAIKPDYYKNIDFSTVVFPALPELAYLFPAFVLFDAIEYTKIPEEEMRKYLPGDTVDFYRDLEENGPGGDQGDKWVRMPPPVYKDIFVRKLEDGTFKVTYITSYGTVFEYLSVTDGKVERTPIKGDE